MSYTLKTGQSYRVLVYSDLLLIMFSGIPSDDHNNCMTWPSALPASWTMEWEPSTSYRSNE